MCHKVHTHSTEHVFKERLVLLYPSIWSTTLASSPSLRLCFDTPDSLLCACFSLCDAEVMSLPPKHAERGKCSTLR